MKHFFPFCLLMSFAALAVCSCIVDSVCYNDADCPTGTVCEFLVGEPHGTCRDLCQADNECPSGSICDPSFHTCQPAECEGDTDCMDGFSCLGGRCYAEEPLVCAEGMTPIGDQACMDVFEASRPDATTSNAGLDSSMATSRGGVLPWKVESNAEAEAACAAAGKRLCSEQEWYLACSGSAGTIYSYGDLYEPGTCNGIDTYCDCTAQGSCGGEASCPFSGCYFECGAGFRLDPTGLHSGCTNPSGVFDLNGNLWEHVQNGDGTRVRGGAYNCSDSETFHRCDYVPLTWTPSALGFRCCWYGLASGDAGVAVGAR